MSYPKKVKGWRNLTFDNQQFRWCFVVKAEYSLLKLQGLMSGNQQAVITLREWRDPWLAVGQTEFLPNKPKIVTAKFASQGIAFALQKGWQPDKTGATVYFDYQNDSFVSI